MRRGAATIAQGFGRHEKWWYCTEVPDRSSSMPQFPLVDSRESGNPRARPITGVHGRA